MTGRGFGAIARALAFACLTSAPAAAQTITFPAASLADGPAAVHVIGLVPGAQVVLRVAVVDADGQRWLARATFRADAGGTVDTGRDAALSGSYSGTDAGALFTRMEAVGDSTNLLRFRTDDLRTVITTLAVEDAAGSTLDSLVVQRHLIAPGVTVVPAPEPELRGRLFVPDRGRGPGIVVMGGSEGGYADGLAGLLASRGYVALSLAYFGVGGLPPELSEIPLEYFARAVEWLRARPEAASDRVALFGTSKGAEAALLVASLVPAIDAVVAYAPSSVAWSCICAREGLPSWTWRGRPVAFVAPGADPAYRPARGEPLRPTRHYLHRLRSAPAEAAIPIERMAGPLLLVAGGDDQLWPSLPMARAILERRAAARGHADDRLIAWDGAGHLIGKAFLPAGSTRIAGGRIETGGSPAENARAQAAAWSQVLAFLERALTRAPAP